MKNWLLYFPYDRILKQSSGVILSWIQFTSAEFKISPTVCHTHQKQMWHSVMVCTTSYYGQFWVINFMIFEDNVLPIKNNCNQWFLFFIMQNDKSSGFGTREFSGSNMQCYPAYRVLSRIATLQFIIQTEYFS